ncbi:antitoxin YezG family protein [Bacillus safensis]|uniref:immunity protein YezG family protein n=1 Tax=Bacillus safensis TaxID=561879 RepID=UPI00203BA262|nr:immunity protein YezG family protein [Bacillus safensis]MCM2988258.1 antitoxin YezG family protein [Bacillus safensis]
MRKQADLFKRIAEEVNEIIPTDWYKVVLYAEVLEDSSEVFFFFKTDDQKEYIYSHFIPEIFDVSEDIYEGILLNLHALFKELWINDKEINNDVWNSVTLKLNNKGDFSIEYVFSNILEDGIDEIQKQEIWMYQNIGILPKDEKAQELVIEYIKNKE